MTGWLFTFTVNCRRKDSLNYIEKCYIMLPNETKREAISKHICSHTHNSSIYWICNSRLTHNFRRKSFEKLTFTSNLQTSLLKVDIKLYCFCAGVKSSAGTVTKTSVVAFLARAGVINDHKVVVKPPLATFQKWP